jgi:single-stranded-DNA-specific exonuclease
MLRAGNASQSIASAEELEKLNTLRKDTVKGIKREVMGYDFDIHTHVVVIGNESWGPGVLGLIAQEVFDETGKPTFVYGAGEQENEYKGSCRAPEHVNLVSLMSACNEGIFLGFGGHATAGCFSVAKEKVGELSRALNSAYEKLELSHEVPEEEVIVDALLSFNDVTKALHKELEKLEPCGEGNAKPLFAFISDGVLSLREFGKTGGHFEFLYEQGIKNEEGGGAREALDRIAFSTEGVPSKKMGTYGFARHEETVKAIYFFGEEEKLALARGPHILIAELEESHFGWKPELRLRVVDIVETLSRK